MIATPRSHPLEDSNTSYLHCNLWRTYCNRSLLLIALFQCWPSDCNRTLTPMLILQSVATANHYCSFLGVPVMHSVDGLFANSKDQQQRYAHEIEWKVVGPMPTDEFLDEFFPNPPDLETGFGELRVNRDEIRFASVPNSPVKKEEIYQGLVRVKLSIFPYLIEPISV